MTEWTTFDGVARIFVIAAWCGLALALLVHRRGQKVPAAKRDPAARWGMALQGASFAAVWMGRKSPYFLPALMGPGQAFADVFTIVLTILSMWLVAQSIRVLGKQWAYEARLIEGHRLVVAGPYSHVRNPIYTGILGMLIATGLVLSVWWALLIAIGIFLLGTLVRIRIEERLLVGAFGEDFTAYCDHVPALLPRWRSH